MSKAPAVDNALKIIEFFSQCNEEIGISDICNSLGINKNMTSRIIEALLEEKWIYLSNENQKKYRFTVKPFSLISKSIPQRALCEIAEGELKKLNNLLGDSVYLGIKNEKNVLYLLHFDSTKEVRINGRVGGEYPLHTSAPGKVLLAYSDEKEAYFASESEISRFNKEADKIRLSGYAIDDEEFAKGIICIACPVFDHTGAVAASIGISSLTIYDDIKSLTEKKYPLLREAAINISKSFGMEN